jgi:hypothetical protein
MELTVSPKNTHFKVIARDLYSFDGKELILHFPDIDEAHYDIPEGTEKICECAFVYCNDIVSITLPDTVTTIDNRAFLDMGGLKSVTIPSSVKTIGAYAFGCTSLKDVYYKGSQSDWKKIKIDKRNEEIKGGIFNKSKQAAIHYDHK